MILFKEPTLADALCFLNTDTPNWWSWINPEDGEVYSNVQSNIDGVDVPSEDECNTKLEELQAIWDSQNADYVLARQNAYPSIYDQLDEIYHNGIDSWKEIIKKVKDDNPKE